MQICNFSDLFVHNGEDFGKFLSWIKIRKLSELTMEPSALAEGMKALEKEQMLWRPGVQVQFVVKFSGRKAYRYNL